MKFISKNANLRIVLKHGIPSEPITGRGATPGLYIKFENGMVNIENEETQKLMLAHSGFNSDYICAEENNEDPFAHQRREAEPEHDVTEIKYGQIGKNLNPRKGPVMTPEQKKAMTDMAKEMAMQMAPELAKKLLEEMASKKEVTPVEEVEEAPEYPIEDVLEDEATEEPVVDEAEAKKAASIAKAKATREANKKKKEAEEAAKK